VRPESAAASAVAALVVGAFPGQRLAVAALVAGAFHGQRLVVVARVATAFPHGHGLLCLALQ
jgi:hypothetical protein